MVFATTICQIILRPAWIELWIWAYMCRPSSQNSPPLQMLFWPRFWQGVIQLITEYLQSIFSPKPIKLSQIWVNLFFGSMSKVWEPFGYVSLYCMVTTVHPHNTSNTIRQQSVIFVDVSQEEDIFNRKDSQTCLTTILFRCNLDLIEYFCVGLNMGIRGYQRCNFVLQIALNCLNLKWQLVEHVG